MSRRALLLGFLSATIILANDGMDFAAVQESLCRIPPKHRAGWLCSRGLDDSYYTTYRPSVDSGLRLVGKYGRGPSFSVAGSVSFVTVALGSEVAVVDVASPLQPRVLSEIQLGFLPSRVRATDTLMLAGGNGVEIWDLAVPANPRFVSRIPYAVSDFCVRDSFVFLVSLDTFMVFSIGDPAHPTRVGSCADSGYAVSVANNTVVLMRLSGLGFVDVTQPASPRSSGSYPGYFWSAAARGNVCCVTVGNPNQPTWLQLHVLDISDPAAVYRLGLLDSAGGYNLAIEDSFMFASGFYTGGHEFQIVSIRDSTRPVAVGSLLTHGDNWDVWVNRQAGKAYVADRTQGLALIDIANPAQPRLDTAILRADMAYDVDVFGRYAYVADYSAGLKVLDLSDPTRPTEVSALDTMAALFTSTSVAARDSFVFAAWWPQPKFRAISVTNPLAPTQAGGCNTFDQALDIVVRDTLAYLAERLRFQVVNVARPRQPVLVGSCVTGDATSAGLWLADTLAYVANDHTQIVRIANPAAPSVIGEFGRGAWDAVTSDTVAFLTSGVLVWYGVANPTAPRAIDSIGLGFTARGLAIMDTVAYVGSRSDLCAVSIADLFNPRVISRTGLPYAAKRITYAEPYLYVTCWEAGVCIFETVSVGICEAAGPRPPPSRPTVHPNPTRGRCSFERSWKSDGSIIVRDVTGRAVLALPERTKPTGMSMLDLSMLEAGVYFLDVGDGLRRTSVKLMKQ